MNVTDHTPALAEQAGWDDGSTWTEDEKNAWQLEDLAELDLSAGHVGRAA